jgi:hypothetical protein
MTAFSGGTFEASGVAYVPGTDGVLFVDDGRPNEIFWMRLGSDRKQSGAIETIDIATSIIDLEGITTDGSYFYVIGSQSKSKGADLVGLARFKFDAAGQRVSDTQTASGLKKFLADNVSELRGMENTKYNDGGINVEGVAWDPRAGPNSERMDFKFWEWSGNDSTPSLREGETFDRRLKPEGITRVLNGAQDFTFIVFDTSGYAATD